MLYKYVPHLVLLPLGLEVLGIDLELVVEVLGLQSAVDWVEVYGVLYVGWCLPVHVVPAL